MDTLTSDKTTQDVEKGVLTLRQGASGPSANSTARAAPANVSVKKENFDSPNGPSPEKGSGQYRFRQMLGHTGPVDITNSGAQPTTINNHNQGSFRSSTDPVYGVYTHVKRISAHLTLHPGPIFPTFQQGMHSDSDTSLTHHSLAVNQAVYPTAPSMARPMSHPFMPQSNTGPNGDKNGKNWVHDRYAGGNTRIPTPGVGTPTWTSILSAECQKRHFNPQFQEWVNYDGTYQCAVILNGITMNDSRCWDSAADAKQALSQRAVEYIRKTPVLGGLSHRAQEKANLKAEGKVNHRPDDKTKKQGALSEQEEERRLLTRIQSLYGQIAGPSASTMANPAAAHAFLEGFALGSKLRESALNSRRRSRSPLRSDRGGGR
ncbi:hypothetical protein SCUP515_04373 [Seiridium cupressi]